MGERESRYYTALGKACDDILRCKDCQRLVLHATLVKFGCCPDCGNKRVMEVTTLTVEEHDRITHGVLDFPHRAEFLEEFSPVE